MSFENSLELTQIYLILFFPFFPSLPSHCKLILALSGCFLPQASLFLSLGKFSRLLFLFWSRSSYFHHTCTKTQFVERFPCSDNSLSLFIQSFSFNPSVKSQIKQNHFRSFKMVWKAMKEVGLKLLNWAIP